MTDFLPKAPAGILGMLEAAVHGMRVSAEQALELHERAPLFALGRAAHAIRMRKHPEPVVTFVSDRNINYSNVCVCGCKFCAFYRAPGHAECYVLSPEEMDAKIEETKALGGTQILMQGGHHPDLPLSFYEEMVSRIKERHGIHVHAFSPPEITHFAKLEGLDPGQVVARLKAAGLDSIPGGGAEILNNEVRQAVAPNKGTAEEWLYVMHQAHLQGLRTTATMMFGHVDKPEHRVEHMIRLRALQDETEGFTAFIPWTFQPDNTALDCRKLTAPEYLRVLALSRIVLDNFDNIQVSWVTMGPKVAQTALFFGGNDFGSTMIEENVVAAAGVRFRMGADEIARIVRAAGFEPKQRLMDYSLLESK